MIFMCTAVSYNTDFYHYFGRNLDLDYSYNEAVIITPRNFNFKMRCVDDLQKHYALIGMATVFDGVPLYYEATNEKGLSVAGLNFPDNADYKRADYINKFVSVGNPAFFALTALVKQKGGNQRQKGNKDKLYSENRVIIDICRLAVQQPEMTRKGIIEGA